MSANYQREDFGRAGFIPGWRWSSCIPQLRENPKTPLAKRRDPDSTERMIRPGFLDIELRQNLIELARERVGRSSSGPTCERAGVY